MLDFPPDFTFFVQLVGFFVLLAILNKLLFVPFSRVLEERERQTTGATDVAMQEQLEADELKKSIDAALADARMEASSIAETIRREARAEEAAIYDEGKGRAAAKLADLRYGIDNERSVAESELKERARALAASMVTAVLGEEEKA